MTTSYSLWLEPQRDICVRVERIRAAVPPYAPNRYAVSALPPWFVFDLDCSEPPPIQRIPEWTQYAPRHADRQMQRDRSSGLYSSPLVFVDDPCFQRISSGMPGEFLALRLSSVGGVLPDLRLYAGNFDGAVPAIREGFCLYLPLLWLCDGSTGYSAEDSELLRKLEDELASLYHEHFSRLRLRSARTSIHLLKTEVEIHSQDQHSPEGDSIAYLEWESQAQVDLRRYSESG